MGCEHPLRDHPIPLGRLPGPARGSYSVGLRWGQGVEALPQSPRTLAVHLAWELLVSSSPSEQALWHRRTPPRQAAGAEGQLWLGPGSAPSPPVVPSSALWVEMAWLSSLDIGPPGLEGRVVPRPSLLPLRLFSKQSVPPTDRRGRSGSLPIQAGIRCPLGHSNHPDPASRVPATVGQRGLLEP